MIPGLGRALGGGNGNQLQYSCLENPMDRSLMGYWAWGRKELDVAEWLSTAQHIVIYINAFYSFMAKQLE